jgi:hypothetical protein
LQGLVDFYLAHPVRGIAASVLLIYQPPLLDILPMYIIFLALTPLALSLGARHGWKWVLGPSLAIWLWAQFGLKSGFYWALITFFHLNIPFSALGAFDWFAWQMLWAVGLWIGHGQPTVLKVRPRPFLALAGASILAAFFCVARHSPLWEIMNNGAWTLLTDKWHLGALRLLNFTCLAIIFGAIQPKVAGFFRKGGNLVLLGQSSLEVFCAHLLVCFAALAMVGDGGGLGILPQLGLILAGMAALVGTAHLFARKPNG